MRKGVRKSREGWGVGEEEGKGKKGRKGGGEKWGEKGGCGIKVRLGGGGVEGGGAKVGAWRERGRREGGVWAEGGQSLIISRDSSRVGGGGSCGYLLVNRLVPSPGTIPFLARLGSVGTSRKTARVGFRHPQFVIVHAVCWHSPVSE